MTTLRTCAAAVISLIISTAPPLWARQYQLYTPQQVAAEQKVTAQDGILVEEIEIKKGDTLYDLSRKFNGRGMYYPQILLFNSIKNPNLIYTGKNLKIPVYQQGVNKSERSDAQASGIAGKPRAVAESPASPKAETQVPARQSSADLPAAAPATELSLTDLKSVTTKTKPAGRHKKKTALMSRKSKSPKTSAVPAMAESLPVAHKGLDAGAATPAGDAAGGQKLFEAASKAYRLDDCRTALELLDRFLQENSSSPLAADANLYKADCYLKMSAQ